MAEPRSVEQQGADEADERLWIHRGHPAWEGLVEAVRRGNRALIARQREVRADASR